MFPDVPQNHWARNYIAIGKLLGIAKGYPNDPNYFKPNDPATRAEALVFSMRSFMVGLVFAGGFSYLAYYMATKKAKGV